MKATAGCGAFYAPSAGGCLCWAEASQRHVDQGVLGQRRLGSYLSLLICPFSGKKREEFRKGMEE